MHKKREGLTKNVLLITVDHWPGRLLGCEGREDFLSPSLDELAKCGIRFNNAYSSTPVCIPARRELMTGTTARTHGDRVFNEHLKMPDNLTTLAQTFRNAGYQAYAVGKLHVSPQRARIGFDDVILNEEGRRINFPNEMREDDYNRFLAREGYAGLDYAHGMSNNNYISRPWHLPEYLHQTNWTAREMCEFVMRRDPGRPSFWYCSFTAPHPPLVPVKEYLEMYDDIEPDLPFMGEWTKDFDKLPYCVKYYRSLWDINAQKRVRMARKAFYATCTQIDHQIRTVIGTLREAKLLKDTIIAFTSDHGDMLGNHGLWMKNLFYEDSCKIPLIIVPTEDCPDFEFGGADNRLVELRDVMPTLLTMAGVEIPDGVEGMSLTDKNNKREYVYGELWEDDRATRMIRTERYKLIYYAVGNRFQLFDMENDPDEMLDLSENESYQVEKNKLMKLLMDNLYGDDVKWVKDGKFVGLPDKKFSFKEIQSGGGVLKNRELLLQRGLR